MKEQLDGLEVEITKTSHEVAQIKAAPVPFEGGSNDQKVTFDPYELINENKI